MSGWHVGAFLFGWFSVDVWRWLRTPKQPPRDGSSDSSLEAET